MKTLKKTLLLLVCLVMCGNLFAQYTYKNPVIPGFYPDPSVCRVNDDYYLVTSTFEYFPGVPVFHSKDMVNWKQIGHCLTRESQLKLHNIAPSGGIYAPTIRYNNGTFYMVTTNVNDKGNFYVHTKDPAGEWSEPIWVKQGGIDPTLFFDNGKCYFLSIPDGIQLCEIDVATGKQLSNSKVIWRGTGGRYPEAPHLYKKDGWYYLLIAEGGTEYGHKVTIARSRELYGPYESNPANPILTHINEHTQGNAIQGVGHADLIEGHDGSWWSVFLGFRPQSYLHHLLGRETFLAPVRWDTNAWPVINGNGAVTLDMNVSHLLPQHPWPAEPIRDEFNSSKLNLKWNYLRNPNYSNYSITNGALRLKGDVVTLDDNASPTFLGRRQQHINFTASTPVDIKNISEGDEAGITVYMNSTGHYDMYVTQKAGKRVLQVKYHLGNINHIEKEIEIDNNPLTLFVTGSADYYEFSYKQGNKASGVIAKVNTRFISSETLGGFTGVYLGLYAVSKNKANPVIADFNWFEYTH
ncbi:glycoside hydrolase family 43 protein [Bacteroides sp. 519]|uniref:glycoside hydrolase family 43 protein n=1 Tax=Bacteroides sp. 519 TaxID=2302937 RepID=UPI0013D1EA35|nr:glycoside hydrolase family 43 protein [Bacteroides sp. 519]NDV57805.1 glycoside hydrolase family 43 protein [Bacteroides sp. 519]